MNQLLLAAQDGVSKNTLEVVLICIAIIALVLFIVGRFRH